jgi:hypothetical protein
VVVVGSGADVVFKGVVIEGMECSVSEMFRWQDDLFEIVVGVGDSEGGKA